MVQLRYKFLHLSHCLLYANKYASGYYAETDGEFLNLFNRCNVFYVEIIKAMPCMNSHAKLGCKQSCIVYPLQLIITFIQIFCLTIFARMYFYAIGVYPMAGLNLFRFRIDKEIYPDACIFQCCNKLFEGVLLCPYVQSAFGCQFLPFFSDKRYHVGF